MAVSGYRLQGIQNTVPGYQLPDTGNTKYNYRLQITGCRFQGSGLEVCKKISHRFSLLAGKPWLILRGKK